MLKTIRMTLEKHLCWWQFKRDMGFFNKLVDRANLRFHTAIDSHNDMEEDGRKTKERVNDILLLFIFKKQLDDMHSQLHNSKEIKTLQQEYPEIYKHIEDEDCLHKKFQAEEKG